MEDLLDRMRELPCGRRLLDAAAGLQGVHLVGGAVRDLLLGREPRELDVVVEGAVGPLAARLGAPTTEHERFGTATVRYGQCHFDLAAARAEEYAHPGALPAVRAAPIEADLRRRDVTVNALALDLASGELRAAEHAREDLQNGLLRVLHDASFVDDPTRLWRIARYAARLGFDLEAHTARLAADAVRSGALDTVSGTRIGNELRLVLSEPGPVGALNAVVALGLAPWLQVDPARVAAALQLLPAGEGRPDLVALAAGLGAADDELLAELAFTAADRAILRACRDAPALAARALAAGPRASALARALRGVPVEAIVLAGADGAAEPVRRWLDELRHVKIELTGGDLLRAGMAEGPEIGRRLAVALDRRLDGELAPGGAAELDAALAAHPD